MASTFRQNRKGQIAQFRSAYLIPSKVQILNFVSILFQANKTEEVPRKGKNGPMDSIIYGETGEIYLISFEGSDVTYSKRFD